MTPRNVASRRPTGAAPDDRAEVKPPPPVTPAYLERAALHYLERYSASVAMLRQTLKRRVDKRCRLRGEEASAFAEAIEATVARAVGAGLVDDARFTAGRLAALRRRGASARALSAKLAAKGVSREQVASAMEAERETAEAGVDLEAEAARAYAKRRRLGPWRRPGTREAHRDRDLAAMARAGFPYGLSRRVIEADPDAEPLDHEA
ncbi:RecX family transcriptional regulator [Methylobacterium sp. Leaf111]|uniref:regulatory protein RecX n=1 Tax=Methylobacterium sp. Leaf111 TaxID=1736257 RepID=UPI0006FC0BEA|nr:RecX family transcriptional regulator [Methylobacterium sp. Leaf111]KQP76951.1 RecX family transcriptional regulator [Methylobacterium sp. Leaf111]